jgi:glutathione peroxidase
LAALLLAPCLSAAALPAPAIYQAPVLTQDGGKADLSAYKGKVLLIVNTASKCGYTPQYKGLQETYEKYSAKGLVVLGFPSNDFNGQEPGTNAEIKKFCELKYNVKFPLFGKDKVKGPEKQALYRELIAGAATHEEISWNFEKFLVSRDGKVIGRFKSAVTPRSDELAKAIEAAL